MVVSTLEPLLRLRASTAAERVLLLTLSRVATSLFGAGSLQHGSANAWNFVDGMVGAVRCQQELLPLPLAGGHTEHVGSWVQACCSKFQSLLLKLSRLKFQVVFKNLGKRIEIELDESTSLPGGCFYLNVAHV